MLGPKKKARLSSLKEQRKKIRDKICKAMAENNFKEIDKLEAKLYWLDGKIEKLEKQIKEKRE